MPRSGATAERVDRPENRAAEAPRDPRGRMLPGTTLNPGGRPKAWREFQAAVRERSPEALAIIDEALKSEDPAQRQWAVEKVLAYGLGRPPQGGHVGGDAGGPPVRGGGAPPQRARVGADEAAPPVRVGRAIDWGLLPPERLGQLLEIMDSVEAA